MKAAASNKVWWKCLASFRTEVLDLNKLIQKTYSKESRISQILWRPFLSIPMQLWSILESRSKRPYLRRIPHYRLIRSWTL